jgi:PAS domain S-box-containing protein
MERKHLEKAPEAETPLPHVRRATSMLAWTPPAKGRRAREGISDPSAGRDGKRSSWTALAMNLPGKMPDVARRYSLALVVAGLALYIRGVLPVMHGTAVYQLPIAAVVLSAWYGGRGPGLLASLICATGILYWFLPPVNSFELSPDYAIAYFIFIALCLLFIEFGAGHKRVQVQLQARQEMLDLAQKSAGAVAFDWFIGARESENLWSPELEVMYGLEPGTFDRTYEGWKKLVHPDDWPVVKLALKRAHECGDIAAEYRVIHKDGAVHWLRAKGRMFLDAKGRPERMVGFMIDVTDRRQAEEELRASEARFRMLVDHATDGFYLSDDQSRIIDVNEAACQMLGYSREELVGRHPREFDAALDEASVAQLAQRVLAGQTVTFETLHRRRDGTVFPVEIRGRGFEKGGRRLLLALVRDITERRLAEEELRASEERFRTFVDRATDAFFLLDEQLQVVDVNRQACESLGWSREELIGTYPRHFDVALDEPSIRRLTGRASLGEVITFETRHRRKDGATFPVEIRTGTFRQGGKLFYLALARDISERKQAEERKAKLAAIVESSDDAIISKDLNGIITTWNTGAERIFGYAAREVIGQSVTILVPPDRVDELRGILERIRRGERIDHFETVRRRKDGTLLDVSLTVSPIIDESGNVVGASKVARDISERKRAENALREKDEALEMARTELERVARLTTLGEMTTSIAHEVSQPLGAMVASAGACARWLAADPPAMAEARATLDNIVADGKRAREVIARIRALTKRQAPRKDWLDINQEVVNVLALTEHELRSHDIVLRTDLRGTLPRVAGDRVQLQQVLLNLVVNAVEAMSAVHDRPRELTIVSRLDDPDAVLVEVRDSGAGLDPQRAEQVFEAFYTTKTEGIGIGLSISRSIIEAHGGLLSASANAPYGAVFRFSLPVTAEAVA